MLAAETTSAPTRLDGFFSAVLPPDKREQLARALPKHIRPDLFERNLLNALMATPALLKCDPREVFREVAQVAALGLMLDPALGEAWLFAGYSNRERRHVPQRRIGYRGLLKLARQSGEVSALYAHEVCARDGLDYCLGTEKRFEHRPDLFSPDRGPVIGFYAVARFRDGETDLEAMSQAEVDRIRDRYSEGWRAKAERSVWSENAVEMGKKTVLRRLLKRLPQSPELAGALMVEGEDARLAALSGPAGGPPGPRLRISQALGQRIAAMAGEGPIAGQGPIADRPQAERELEPEPEPEPEEEPETEGGAP